MGFLGLISVRMRVKGQTALSPIANKDILDGLLTTLPQGSSAGRAAPSVSMALSFMPILASIKLLNIYSNLPSIIP